jgi:hypothetical protein
MVAIEGVLIRLRFGCRKIGFFGTRRGVSGTARSSQLIDICESEYMELETS